MQRYISSLSSLLGRFGVVYVILPKSHISIAEVRDRAKKEDTTISIALEMIKEERNIPDEKGFLAIMESYERPDCLPPTDLGVRYGIKSWDESAADEGEDLMSFLRNFSHAAQCGCEGCRDRIQLQYERYQKKKEEAAKT